MSEEYNAIGKNVRMVGGFEKVTGKATYNNEVRLPGMLYAKVLRSPYASGEILEMDTSKAEALSGVKLVMSYRNFPDVFHQYAFYIGAEMAMVVATDEELVEEAWSSSESNTRSNHLSSIPKRP